MKYDVITSGSGLVDAFVNTGIKEDNGKICFIAGTKIEVKDIIFSVGGGGINTASSFAKMGLRTGFIGKVGSGYNSQIILRALKERGIHFLGVKSKEHAGYSIVLESDKKHRTILTYKGVSNSLSYNELNLKNLDSKWFHFTSLSGESFETQKKLVDYAKKKNIRISYNPSSYQLKSGFNYISKIIKNTHILSLNKEEAEMLVGKKDTCRKLHELGPEIICITNGENVGEVFDGNFMYKFYPNKVKADECTGAGDSFASGFVAGFLKSGDIERSIKIAMANAESNITKRGANTGVLSWNGVEKVLKNKTFKVKMEKL